MIRSRPGVAFGSPLVLALPVAFLAFALVVVAGLNLSLAVVGIVVIGPILVLNDGAPLVFLMAALPAATLFNNTSAGLGGAKILAIFTLICLALGVLLSR